MSETKQVTLRVEATVLDRIDEHAERLKRRTPGLAISRVGAIRALLLDALTRAEGQPERTGRSHSTPAPGEPF